MINNNNNMDIEEKKITLLEVIKNYQTITSNSKIPIKIWNRRTKKL